VDWLNYVVTRAPKIFIFLALAIGTMRGRIAASPSAPSPAR
jgi:hypothetical protein